MTTVRTARVGSREPDALDVTRKSAGRDGIAFAPSWALLGPFLSARRAGADTEALWPGYVAAYTAEMRASYRAARGVWERLLARPRVVLLCYCTDPERCHRTLLARDILPTLGATYAGELARGER